MTHDLPVVLLGTFVAELLPRALTYLSGQGFFTWNRNELLLWRHVLSRCQKMRPECVFVWEHQGKSESRTWYLEWRISVITISRLLISLCSVWSCGAWFTNPWPKDNQKLQKTQNAQDKEECMEENVARCVINLCLNEGGSLVHAIDLSRCSVVIVKTTRREVNNIFCGVGDTGTTKFKFQSYFFVF